MTMDVDLNEVPVPGLTVLRERHHACHYREETESECLGDDEIYTPTPRSEVIDGDPDINKLLAAAKL